MSTATYFGFLHAARVLEGRLEASLGEIGLSAARFGVLDTLAAAEAPVPLRTLAERQSCVRSNITQLVDRLVQDGLVSRTPDPADRRSLLAALTPAGRLRHAEGAARLETEVGRFSARLPEAEVAALAHAVDALTDEG